MLKKYTTDKTARIRIANEINVESKKIPVNEFVRQVSNFGDERIAAKFSEIYQVWKKDKFNGSLKQFIRNFKREAEKELLNKKQKIERQHFDEICDNLESKYQMGDLFKIIDVVGRFTLTSFVSPKNLIITCYLVLND